MAATSGSLIKLTKYFRRGSLRTILAADLALAMMQVKVFKAIGQLKKDEVLIFK